MNDKTKEIEYLEDEVRMLEEQVAYLEEKNRSIDNEIDDICQFHERELNDYRNSFTEIKTLSGTITYKCTSMLDEIKMEILIKNITK